MSDIYIVEYSVQGLDSNTALKNFFVSKEAAVNFKEELMDNYSCFRSHFLPLRTLVCKEDDIKKKFGIDMSNILPDGSLARRV